MSGVLQEAVRQKAHALADAVGSAVESPATPQETLAEIDGVLSRAVEELTSIQRRMRRTHRAAGTASSPDDVNRYFPADVSPRHAVAAAELHEAGLRWQAAFARGHRFREEAAALVGPLVRPAEAAARLGVSKATLTNWRREHRLLALRFDNHQYVYPAFQFADSPALGEQGVLHHLGQVLAALGDLSPWDKALFFFAPSALLGGATPLEILRARRIAPEDLDRVVRLAQYGGEVGT